MSPEEKLTTQQKLDALPHDAARSAECKRLAEEARRALQAFRIDWIEYVLASTSPRYRVFGTEARKKIGHQKWQKDAKTAELIGDDQFFRGLADHYALQARLPEL